MNPPGISEIRQELKNLTASELAQVVLKLARFRKENKEMLSFLLFGEHDLPGYVEEARSEMEAGMYDVYPDAPYQAKKTIRKVLRLLNKRIQISGSKQAEAELLIRFCGLLVKSGIHRHGYPVLSNIFKTQLRKADRVVESLHEDLQYDMKRLRKELIPDDLDIPPLVIR